MADVRSELEEDFEPQFAFRGIPKDTSCPHERSEDFWLGDHSFTYAYLDEILCAPWKSADLHDSYFYIFCAYIINRLADPLGILDTEDKRNIRIIMGFDS